MKPGTFTQLYEQLVFAVKYRECLLNQHKRIEIFSYISGIIKNIGHKPLIVNGYADHVHIFYGRNPVVATSDTVGTVKKSSAWFINEQKWFRGKFQWQDGYGAFSYSRSQIDEVYKYVARQEEHHKTVKFREEYIKMLETEQVDFEERFLFEFFENINCDLS